MLRSRRRTARIAASDGLKGLGLFGGGGFVDDEGELAAARGHVRGSPQSQAKVEAVERDGLVIAVVDLEEQGGKAFTVSWLGLGVAADAGT
jgi:hypothetical protein